MNKFNPTKMNGEVQNSTRAMRAEDALNPFLEDGEQEAREACIDLITNLMHFCDREEINFEYVLTTARIHHEAEK